MNEEMMEKISRILKRKFGLTYSGPNQQTVLKKVSEFIRKKYDGSVDVFYEDLSQKKISDRDYKELIDILTINETYFFRERRTIDVLKQEILPQLLFNGNTSINIWCAACSSGEEAYTISIILKELMEKHNVRKKVHIIGTDINVKKLEQGIKGIYREWSFRNVPDALKEKYFEKSGNNVYRIQKGKIFPVNFFYLNLVNPLDYDKLTEFKRFDLVLARNVFIYFERDVIEKVGKLIYSVIRKDGYFITSSVEANSDYFPQFQLVHYPGTIVFRKSDKKQQEKKLPVIPDVGERLLQKKRKRRKPSVAVRPSQAASSGKETGISAQKEFSQAAEIKLSLMELQRLVDEAKYMQARELLNSIEAKFRKKTLSGELLLQLKLLKSRIEAAYGELDNAMNVLNEIEKENNLLPELHYLKGLIYMEMNQTDSAIQSFDRALFLQPDFFMARYMKAILFLYDHQKEKGKHILGQLRHELNSEDESKIIYLSDGVEVREMQSLIEHLLEN